MDIWKDLTINEVFTAYEDCRKNKSTKDTTIEFEIDVHKNLYKIYKDLKYKTYEIGESIKFVTLEPKPREIWAANFRDRIVQHIVYNRISPKIYNLFSPDTCACIPGRGTHYAAKRLHKKVQSITNNWKEEAYYLKCDFSNFFNTLNKEIIYQQITEVFNHKDLLWLIEKIIFHDSRTNYKDNSNKYKDSLVPKHKSLLYNDILVGIPIGNITSQLFANFYLRKMDNYINKTLKVSYIRYVDDFIVLSKDKEQLKQIAKDIRIFIKDLKLELNPKKTFINKIHRGVDFVGFVSKPYHLEIRKRTMKKAKDAIYCGDFKKIYAYLGMLKNGNNYNKRTRIKNNMYKYMS